MPKTPSRHYKRESMSRPLSTNGVRATETRSTMRRALHRGLSTASNPVPFIDRYPRPSRWRGEGHLNRAEGNARVLQSIYDESPAEYREPVTCNSAESAGIKMRFSFASNINTERQTRHRGKGKQLTQKPSSTSPETHAALSHSFSELSFDKHTSPQASTPQTQSTKPSTAPRLPFVPDLSKPKTNREGYGFSYSESMWYDSDEYPDTECNWEPEEAARTLPSSYTSATVIAAQDTSFVDMVVLRDIGTFEIAHPQKILPCTSATREDTIRLKDAAKTLLRFRESAEISGELLTRVERMVTSALNKAINSVVPDKDVTYRCALQLYDFLVRVKEERVGTGENRRMVEHEVEWARWMVDASRTGVLHFKSEQCQCRPGWEEQ